MSHHVKTMETGAWILLGAAIAFILYLLFNKKTQTNVTASVQPEYPVIDSILADEIAKGTIQAERYDSTKGCTGSVFDSGNGDLFCVHFIN